MNLYENSTHIPSKKQDKKRQKDFEKRQITARIWLIYVLCIVIFLLVIITHFATNYHLARKIENLEKTVQCQYQLPPDKMVVFHLQCGRYSIEDTGYYDMSFLLSSRLFCGLYFDDSCQAKEKFKKEQFGKIINQ